MEFPCRAFLCACGGRYSPPPHAWGILPYLASRYVRGRFIPTCVGNTARPPWARWSRVGSSPHAWGIPGHDTGQQCVLRFIPTCVGNTCIPPHGPGCGVVHPHMRGEYSTLTASSAPARGSSPHAWGIQHPLPMRRSPCRFIPTCVGNTRYSSQRRIYSAVHPHVRGEYSCHPCGR